VSAAQVFLEKAGGCVGEALARFLFQQLVIALDFVHRRGKVRLGTDPSHVTAQRRPRLPTNQSNGRPQRERRAATGLARACDAPASLAARVGLRRPPQVNRSIRPSSLLLALSQTALPLLKLSDFSLSKDTLRHSEPRSQVRSRLSTMMGTAHTATAAGAGGRRLPP
jgi:serine/threonine protein kinase